MATVGKQRRRAKPGRKRLVKPAKADRFEPPAQRRIGLAVDAVAGYGRGVIRGIMSFCRANPHWVITVEPAWSFGVVPDIAEWKVDGLIVQTFSREFEDRVLGLRLPATNVSNYCNEVNRLPTVLPDDVAVARMAAEYLLSLGFRRLGFCWPGTFPYAKLRLDAFAARAAEAGVSVAVCNTSEQEIRQWLVALPKPIGILGCNDDWAHQLLHAARREGVKVPDEVAVLGVDDDELFNTLVTPSLSSVALPAEQIGYQAAVMLDRIMDKRPVGADPLLLQPLHVVARESTDVLAVADPQVVRAVRFIRDHAAQPLQVEDVLGQLTLSRRSLERRFRRLVGHSISEEIRRAHVERAKQLLINTDLPMPEIAEASGFTSATRMGIVFQGLAGEPPTLFRRRSRVSGPAASPLVAKPRGIVAK